MSRRTDRIYSPTVRGDRPEHESRRAERTERTERTERLETVPRAQAERSLQEPPRSDSPNSPSTSMTQRPGRTPNQEDPYSAAQGSKTSRTNEYFVPQEGIDREVVTADICRYLGNDALVRPGTYTNPQTRQPQEGYFITAYRNLTTQMITDLKADSERWQVERRQILDSSRGNARNAQYSSSRTHEARQYNGPSPAVPSSTVPTPASFSNEYRDDYDNAHYHYGSDRAGLNYSSSHGPPSERDQASTASGGYYPGSSSTYPVQSERDNYYSSQAPQTPAQRPYASQQADSRGGYYLNQAVGPSPQAGYPSQLSDPRGAYYPNETPLGAMQGVYSPPQPADPSAGRRYGESAPSDFYGSSYQDSNAYSAPPPSNQGASSSRPAKRDYDRDDSDRRGDRRRR